MTPEEIIRTITEAVVNAVPQLVGTFAEELERLPGYAKVLLVAIVLTKLVGTVRRP